MLGDAIADGSARRWINAGLARAEAPAPAVFLILLVAASMRIVLSWSALTGTRDLVGDEGGYVALAQSLAHHAALAYDGVPTAQRMPLFPLFLAPFYLWTDWSFAPSAAIVMLSTLTCVGIYALGCQLFDRRVGLVAGLLGAVDLNLVVFGGYLLSETLYVFLALVGLLMVVEARRRRSVRWLLVGGGLCGLALLTRPQFLAFVPVVVGWTWLSWGQSRRRATVAALLLAVAIAVVWAPWVIRNEIVVRRLLPFTSQPCPPCTGIYHDGAADPMSVGTFGQWQYIPAPPGFGELDGSDQRRDRAITWIREHPGSAATIALAQVGLLWRPSGLQLGPLSVIARATSSLLLILAAYGLFRTWRGGCGDRRALLLWVAAAAAMTAFAVLTIGDPRHRLALHPVLDVLAAVAVIQALRSCARHGSPGRPRGAAPRRTPLTRA